MPPTSPDEPELRLIGQLAGLKPTSLAAALNHPEHWRDHMSKEEDVRLVDAIGRIWALTNRITEAAKASNTALKNKEYHRAR